MRFLEIIKFDSRHRRRKWREKRNKKERGDGVMSVEERAGLSLLVRPETEFCHCNLTLWFCNDSPAGTNHFLHWCYYCWSRHRFSRERVLAEVDVVGQGGLRSRNGGTRWESE